MPRTGTADPADGVPRVNPSAKVATIRADHSARMTAGLCNGDAIARGIGTP
jgi:hypothetical protein